MPFTAMIVSVLFVLGIAITLAVEHVRGRTPTDTDLELDAESYDLIK